MLKLSDISLSVQGTLLFRPCTITVEAGQVVTVMGPSGSGKSSLLAFASGTLGPGLHAEGRVEIDHEDLTDLAPENRRLGLLFQDDLLFPHMSVSENLAFGLPSAIRGGDRVDAVERALDEAELSGMGKRDPATLSGGQRARVSLMRTLLSGPRALLLDEPFGRLDQELRDRVRRFVFAHAGRRNLPTLLVTHDPADAEAAGGPIFTLEPPHEGGFSQASANLPESFNKPP